MIFRCITRTAAFAVQAAYMGLILSVTYFWDTATLVQTWTSPRTLAALRISLSAATAAASLALVLAVPAGYALSRQRFRGRIFIDTLLEFPLLVSPAALGALLLIFFNTPPGVWVQENAMRFVFAFSGIVLAQFFSVLGVAVRVVKTTLDDVPTRYETVARTLGAGPHQVFWTVTVPLARRGLATAFLLSWAKAVGEFGATITVAGTMAMRTETLPVAVYMRLAQADIPGAVALIILVVFFGLGTLLLARYVARSVGYAASR